LAGDLRALESLKRSIDAHFAACGFVAEARPFRPHLTLGRASAMSPGERRKLAKVLDEQRAREFGPWQIERVDLVQSVLSAQGAAYTTLESIALEKP
jgi:2'-5' RNA ligase